jgi:hypothetical protein
MNNRSEIIKWSRTLIELHSEYNSDLEVRVVKKTPDGRTVGNVKRFRDPELLADFVKGQSKDLTANIYTTLNPTSARNNGAASDAFVEAYLWLPVDCDPIRLDDDGNPLKDQKIPTTDKELKSAVEASERIEHAIFVSTQSEDGEGMYPTVKATSGNGAHLLYRIQDWGDVKEASMLVKSILEKFHKLFIEHNKLKLLQVDIDRVVYNPARIWKLYGTQARKGEPTDTRTWRQSKIDHIGDVIHGRKLTKDNLIQISKNLDKELIRVYKAQLPQETKTDYSELEWTRKYAGVDLCSLNVVKAFGEAGLLAESGVVHSTGEDSQFVAVKCPNESEHSSDTGTRQAVVFLPKGKAFANFNCFHSHCCDICGAQTAYDMLGEELVRKHCKQISMTDPIEIPKTPEVSQFDKPEDRELAPKPIGIEESWIRPLSQVMIEPPPKEKRETLVNGLIKRGEIMTLQAPTKVGKTFQLMHMALAWSHGKEYLGFKAARPLSILFIDPELLPDEGEFRLRWVATNVLLESPAIGAVSYVNLRGKPLMSTPDPWHALTSSLHELLKNQTFDLIIIDSIYQFQGERDPNASNEVVRMMNQLKTVTEANGKPSVIYVHHFAKGNPSAKTGLDRAAGSYAFNAAADSIVVISPHQEKEHYTIEFFLRHHKSPSSLVAKTREDIRILDLAEGLDPASIDGTWAANVSLGESILKIMREEELKHNEYVSIRNADIKFQAKKRLGLSDKKYSDCMAIMVDEENVERDGIGANLHYKLTPKGRQIARVAEETKLTDMAVDVSNDKEPEEPPTGQIEPLTA